MKALHGISWHLQPALRRAIVASTAGVVVCAAYIGVAAFAPAPEDSTGSIRGVVALAGSARYSGTPPAPTRVDMGGDAYCTGQHPNGLTKTAVRVGGSGGLRDVVVYLRGAPAARPSGEAPPVVLDQVGCEYTPRVVAVRADQPLTIRNSDATLHNVHVRAENNRDFNIGQPIRGLTSTRTFANAEVGIHVSCDVHGWMEGHIAVFDHPYFAVSGEDGSFSIEGVPAGQYVLEAWHPTLGVQQQSITVDAGGNAEVAFSYSG